MGEVGDLRALPLLAAVDTAGVEERVLETGGEDPLLTRWRWWGHATGCDVTLSPLQERAMES